MGCFAQVSEAKLDARIIATRMDIRMMALLLDWLSFYSGNVCSQAFTTFRSQVLP